MEEVPQSASFLFYRAVLFRNFVLFWELGFQHNLVNGNIMALARRFKDKSLL